MANKAGKVALLVLVALVCIYLFLHSSVFNINKITVTGNTSKVTGDEIIALAGITPGENLFKIDRRLVERSVAIHPMVKSAQLIRHLPHTVEIKITERASWAVVPFEDLFLLIDDEGHCLDKLNLLPEGDLPIITMDKMPERVNLGQAVNPEAIKMIKTVWKSLDKQDRGNISQIHYISAQKSLLIYTLAGTEVRYGTLERTEEKAANFTEALKIEASLQKEGLNQLDYVDLRFTGQPVVKTRT
ncbi:MAG TPA: FtsQ-type POTRA domain-containing protein [Syntrophomonas sp.]|nr:FtsQ-type POTRA domain-containing protein [Syntrophomonas sp.]